MTNHPHRSKRRKDAPGRNPRPREISQLREDMGLTQTEFGRHLYAGLSTVQAWEDGSRRMPGLTWEYANLLWAFPMVADARRVWLTGGDPFSIGRPPRTTQEIADDYDAAQSERRDRE